MDIRSQYALQGYAAARQTAGKTGGGGAGPAAASSGFEPKAEANTGAGQVVGSFVDTVMKGEETAKAAIAGRADALSMVEALAATELAMETAVTVRDKVVEAYQEILRMPV